MAMIEIDSPLTGSQVEAGFSVAGYTDQLGDTVNVTVTDGTNTEALTTTSDATTGNWSVATDPTVITPGTGYSVTAVVLIPGGGSASDYTVSIDVCNSSTSGTDPLPIEILAPPSVKN